MTQYLERVGSLPLRPVLIGAAMCGLLLTLNLRLAVVFGYELSPALIGIVWLILAVCKPWRARDYGVAVILAALPFLSLVSLLTVSMPSVHLADFARTYALWLVFVIGLQSATLGARAGKSGQADLPSGFRGGILMALVVMAVFTVLQVVLAKYIHMYALFQPYGPLQSHASLSWWHRNGYWVAAGSERARGPGFFLEPSYNAMVINVAYFISTIRPRRFGLKSLVAAIAILFAGSTSGLLVFIFLFVLGGVVHGVVRAKLLAFAVPAFAFMIAVVPPPPIVAKLSDVVTPGASGNYRLVQPLKILRAEVDSAPAGFPMGSVNALVERFNLVKLGAAGEASPTVDNGILLFLIYFGFLAIVPIAWLVLNARRAASRQVRGGAVQFRTIGLVLLTAAVNGATMTPEVTLLLMMLLLAVGTPTPAAGVAAPKK